jgi:hypothetical protein
MTRLLQLFLEIGDKDNANKIKKAILAVHVACNRRKKDIGSDHNTSENIDITT